MNAVKPRSAECSLEQLSPRERDVLELVGAHMTTKQIVRELGIAITTVDKHLKSIRRKWGTSNRYETARMMRELGGWEKPHPEFSSDDGYLITGQELSSELPRSPEFMLSDVLKIEPAGLQNVPAPLGLEALDERFGKAWRIAAIPLSALLFGLVLIWALLFAKELTDLF